ncbi:hypothetical protein ACHAWX_002136 [Stephanocyclus meneghinianus]
MGCQFGGGDDRPLVVRESHPNRRSIVGTDQISSALCCATGKSLEFERANVYIAKAWAPGLADEYVYSHWRIWRHGRIGFSYILRQVDCIQGGGEIAYAYTDEDCRGGWVGRL